MGKWKNWLLVEEFIQDIQRGSDTPTPERLEEFAKEKLGEKLFEAKKDDIFMSILHINYGGPYNG